MAGPNMTIRIDNVTFLTNVTDLLSSGKDVKIPVGGGSMRPFLKEGRDSVVLRKPTSQQEIVVGKIVLAKYNGSYVLHRVYARKGDMFHLMGDANIRIGETVNKEDIEAYVIAVERDGKIIDPKLRSHKLKATLWRIALPIRKPLIILLSSVKRLVKGRSHSKP